MESVNVQTAESVNPNDATRLAIFNHVQKLLYTVDEIDGLARRIPPDLQEDPIIKQGIEYFEVVKESLKSFVSFLESPIGKATAVLLWKHMSEVRNFVEIAGSVVIATFFVVVGQELLDVKSDQFVSLKKQIENSIQVVRNKLEKIEERVNEAALILTRIGRKEYHESQDLSILLFDFGELVRLAKLDIIECEEELDESHKIIDKATKTLTARLWLNGAFRGAVVISGSYGVYLLIKKNMLNQYLGISIGVLASAIALSVKLPRSRKLQEDFLGYKETQANLRKALSRMRNRLESHENAGLNFAQNNIP